MTSASTQLAASPSHGVPGPSPHTNCTVSVALTQPYAKSKPSNMQLWSPTVESSTHSPPMHTQVRLPSGPCSSVLLQKFRPSSVQSSGSGSTPVSGSGPVSSGPVSAPVSVPVSPSSPLSATSSPLSSPPVPPSLCPGS